MATLPAIPDFRVVLNAFGRKDARMYTSTVAKGTLRRVKIYNIGCPASAEGRKLFRKLGKIAAQYGAVETKQVRSLCPSEVSPGSYRGLYAFSFVAYFAI